VSVSHREGVCPVGSLSSQPPRNATSHEATVCKDAGERASNLRSRSTSTALKFAYADDDHCLACRKRMFSRTNNIAQLVWTRSLAESARESFGRLYLWKNRELLNY
jgi:hypothetical protein